MSPDEIRSPSEQGNRGPTVRSDGTLAFDRPCHACLGKGVVWNDPTTGFPCPYCRPGEYDGRVIRPEGYAS
jgi:hypothetical protein